MNKNEYIFKVCRVHNKIDLNTVINNGANMIGIHAVILDRNEYIKSEEKYFPLKKELYYDKNLPIPIYEVESIKIMQKYVPNNIKTAILFQRPIEIHSILECCKIYNLNMENTYIQLHHRTTKKYVNKIKDNVCKNVIAVVGAFQKDFIEYFNYLQSFLNPKTDYILIDFSEHQSDFSTYDESANKLNIIDKTFKYIQKNRIKIILADDTSIEVMNKYIEKIRLYNVNIKGIDIQNSVEIEKKLQKYEMIFEDNTLYQFKLRKSPKKLKQWKEFIDDNKKYFM